MTAKDILVIVGPTASGKTEAALALALADRRIEIVNADASLLYRGFDIGTAKPSRDVLAEVPHHLIDILIPAEEFSAGEYSKQARAAIREIISRDRVPIIVGGTGLYIDALFQGIAAIGISKEAMQASRTRAQEDIEREGFDAMHELLREIDPTLYIQIQQERNPVRLERAWAHYYATGESLGDARKRVPEAFEFQPEYRMLSVPRPELWQRIETRVDAMIAAGWQDEAKRLMSAGITRDMPAMRAIGYAEMFDVIEGKRRMENAREAIIIRTRQYAKRQVTWMKKYATFEHASGTVPK